MRETKFIEQNKEKWTDFEQELEKTEKDPDKLSTLFIQITDDLSYSRTFYPSRSVRIYLNRIAQGVFQKIYKNRTSKRKRFVFFWKEELPQLVYQARYELLLSLSVFLIAVLIGIVSSVYNSDFARQILGDGYVEMTKENIKNGDPMAVYKKWGQGEMFLGITLNNIIVAFRTFIMGLFYAVGTISVIIYNGIMIGCFQYFFYENGLFVKSFLSIWLHGTLEISSIIIAGGAGITLGKGLVFPGTYSRMQSLRISAQRGLKIMLGIVPILMFAAFIESFITRYTGVPDFVKVILILVSAVFILVYFVWYPYSKFKKGFSNTNTDVHLTATAEYKVNLGKIKTNGEIIKETFIIYKNNLKTIMLVSIIGAVITAVIVAFFYASDMSYTFNTNSSIAMLFFNAVNFIYNIYQYFNYDKFPLLAIINIIQFSLASCIGLFLFSKIINDDSSAKLNYSYIVRNSLKPLLAGLIITSILFITGVAFTWLLIVFQPLFIMFIILAHYEKSLTAALGKSFSYTLGAFGSAYGVYFITVLISILFLFLLSSPYIVWMMFEFITWNFIFDESGYRKFFAGFFTFVSFVGLNMCLALLLISYQLLYFSLKEIMEANNLKKEILDMGQENGLKSK